MLPALAVRRGARINRSGWLVGSRRGVEGTSRMLVHDGVEHDVGELVGEDLEGVVAINERGQLLATRLRGELRQAVLLTPLELR